MRDIWRPLISFFVTVWLYPLALSAADLPVCTNRAINEVTRRVGCTVGDNNCWLVKGGGFCIDYVERMTNIVKAGGAKKVLRPVPAREVRKGDIAQFNFRAHFAYVESVVKGGDGIPVAVNVSEYNYGTCWVDQDLMVTDTYKVVTRRSGIPIDRVDGGFLRAVKASNKEINQ